MSKLSSHSLFHFTHNLQNLQSILQSGIRLSPIGEVIPGIGLRYIVDAACFCNIPLSEIMEHVDWYGSYGIGFKPSFCKTAGATPVCYVHSKTSFLDRSKKRLANYQNNPITPYLKRNCGMQFKFNASRMVWKEFYDEKEWRIVDKKSLNLYSKSTINSLRDLKQAVEDENCRCEKEYLFVEGFTNNDIDYIILASKSEITGFISWMNVTFPKWSKEMIQKIITVEEILKDF